jgi:sugar phosphate isomerase/epimerase
MSATPVLSLITDEVSQDIGEVIAFCAEHDLSHVDIRAVDERNVILFDDRELADLADRLRDAGLTVGCYCSPLLKWPKHGHPVPDGAHFHGFDPGAMSHASAMVHAFEVASVLGAGAVRVFSYLTYPGFTPADLDDDLELLLDLAESNDVDLVLENEHVCNVATLAGIAAVAAHHPHRRLKAAVDVANQISAGHPVPDRTETVAAATLGGVVHMKDVDSAGTYVPVGQGVIDHRQSLDWILGASPERALSIVLETHMPQDGWAASSASIRALKAMLGL